MANNKRALIITYTLLIVTALTSYVSGPASHGIGNFTGSPTASGTCGTCHTGGTDTTLTTLEIQDKLSGLPATTYTPGSTYTITLRGYHPANRQYGFQVAAMNDSGKAVGQYSNLPFDVHTTPYQKSQLAEHNMKIDGDTSGWFITQFDWTPTDSAGNVTIYAIVNAVNGNGQPSFDQPGTTTTVQLTGPTAVLAVANITHQKKYIIYPNPFTSELHINGVAPSAISISTLSGAVVYRGNDNTISTTNWQNGYYVVNIATATGTSQQLIVKQ